MLTAAQAQRQIVIYWLPGLAAGVLAWLAFVALGQTSLIRASGLALVIVGMAMTLRRWGAALAVIGGLALAFSPAFWSQTGGADSLNLPLTLAVLALAALMASLLVFTVLFWSGLANPGSLRLTTLLTVWLLYLLVDLLFITNPHPDEAPPAGAVRPQHTAGALLLLALGVINDPLFTLIVPATALGLVLSRVRLSRWYWLALAVITLGGVYGVVDTYVTSTWWGFPAAQAEAAGLYVPYVMADGWREASRWIYLLELVIWQFTAVGVALGVMGLERLARWYPPLGTVTMVAYATYTLFGLVYFGRNSAVLLLPLLVIQVFWMTYAVHALGAWLRQGLRAGNAARWLAPAIYTLLPLLLLLRITSGV
jgi:hypothetical protein